MLLAKPLKNLLWVLGYPRLGKELVGEYSVGAVRTRLRDCIACQIHYPASENDNDDDDDDGIFHPYFRPEAVDGLANYIRSSSDLLSFLSSKQHPCRINAKPYPNKKFPLVVFSHGIGGCMEMYTQLCQEVASHGYCVVALEHQDGSGCYAETAEGKPIYYIRPDDTPYSRNKVLNFRGPMLEQRVSEVEQVLNFLLQMKKEVNSVPGADVSQPIALLGHSFGAASMAIVSQHLEKSSSVQINSICMLDPWAFSLSDEVLEKGISIPALSILSEGWTKNPETPQIMELLSNSHNVQSFYVSNSVHQSFADSACWLPSFLARKMYQRGENEDRFVTIKAVANACVAHIRRQQSESSTMNDESDSPSEELLKPFPVSQTQKANTDPVLAST